MTTIFLYDTLKMKVIYMKLKIGVIFGGKSLEHEMSIITALQAMENIDTDKYEIIPIYITKDLARPICRSGIS